MLTYKCYRFILPLLLLCISAFENDMHPVSYIVLQNQALNISPKEFYVAAVEDGRKINTNIGKLQPYVNNPDKQSTPYEIDFKGGIAAIKFFVDYVLPIDKSKRPVTIKINMLNVT